MTADLPTKVEIEPRKLTAKTRRAIEAYGEKQCRDAWDMHINGGCGANTIGHELGIGTTQQADAAINAGEELDTEERTPRSS